MSPGYNRPYPMTKIEILKDRASMLAKARSFFQAKDVLEVDCPLITKQASVDAHIDLIPTTHSTETRYLHSSPEYGMKRLITEGIGDIYQLAHVFRQGESGHKHNPEFMMAEWYRLGFTFEEMIAETLDFIRLFLGDLPAMTLSYREVFQIYAGIDYLSMSTEDLIRYMEKVGIQVYPGIAEEGKDALLNIILGTIIEPNLGQEGLLALAYYPSTQAALAKTLVREDEKVAERFEVYYKGMELANGYHELADAKEQRQRLMEANVQRKSLGKETLPIDEKFLIALEKGLPDCCGVAVGVDRLMMLRHKRNNIADVIAFDWNEA